MSTWFQQHRVEWIAESVVIFGFINREHITKKFGVSIPQASLDINLAIKTYPGLLTYNGSTKRYELAADHTAAPRWSPPSVARIRSAMDGDQEAMPATGQPPVGMASHPDTKAAIDSAEYICAQWEKNQGASSLTIALRALLSTLSPPAPDGQQCDRCQGNGEIVTDWDRYRHPHDGDVGDEAVAKCPDCEGEGVVAGHDAPEAPQAAVRGDAKEIVDRLRKVEGDVRRLCLDAAMMVEYLYARPAEQAEPAAASPLEDDGCPKNDPECLGNNGDYHDACEWPLDAASTADGATEATVTAGSLALRPPGGRPRRYYYRLAREALDAAHMACFRHPERGPIGMSHGPFSGVNVALGIVATLESHIASLSARNSDLRRELDDTINALKAATEVGR